MRTADCSSVAYFQEERRRAMTAWSCRCASRAAPPRLSVAPDLAGADDPDARRQRGDGVVHHRDAGVLEREVVLADAGGLGGRAGADVGESPALHDAAPAVVDV